MNSAIDTPKTLPEERGLIDAAQDQARQIAAAMPTEQHCIAPMFMPPPDALVGYEIIREIHRGGQGVVYQAIQKATRRKVALKIMREGPLAEVRDKVRFEREVRVLSQLRHPNIVTIHDSGEVAGCSFYVMDYISGTPLDVYMATGARSMDETLELFATICDAINAAHLRGVIHRDLKPGNILVDSGGKPHILDFGLAKIAGGATTDEPAPQMMTVTGQFVGSLPYASPEQAGGSPDAIDVRSDVYSLGVILYQMLTGCFPYVVIGNMREVLGNILNAQPTRPSTLRRQIKDEVETIMLKCLSKERDRRYQSAGDLGRDVLRYLNGDPIEAKRDSAWYVLRKNLVRRKAAVAACLATLLVAGLGYSAVSRNQELAEVNRRQRVTDMIKAPWEWNVSEPDVEELYDDFFARLSAGTTTPEERELFCRNMNHVDLVCRDIVGLDHDWYIAVLQTNRATFDGRPFWLRTHTDFYLGDQKIAESSGSSQSVGKGASRAFPADLITWRNKSALKDAGADPSGRTNLAEIMPALRPPVQLVLKSVTTIALHTTPFPGHGAPSMRDRTALWTGTYTNKRQVTILPILPPNYPFAITDPEVARHVEASLTVQKVWVSRQILGVEYSLTMPVFLCGRLQLLDPEDPTKVLSEMVCDLPPGTGSGFWGAPTPYLPDDFVNRVTAGELKTVQIRILPDREKAIRSPTVQAYYGNVIERTVDVHDEARRFEDRQD